MNEISFTVCVGLRGPIEAGEYDVANKKVTVSYPNAVDINFAKFDLPKSLSTLFVVSWKDNSNKTITNRLQSNSFERHLPLYEALEAISELLLAYKLVRIGHSDGMGIRTIGIGDTLFHFPAINGIPTGDLNIGLKNYADNNAWQSDLTSNDPNGTTNLAIPHIATSTYPVARRYVRCYELLEHGFYSEAFIVAFSVFDDLIQQSLHKILEQKGLHSKEERDQLLRGIKENRLKIYLGPLLKIAIGTSISTLWPDSKDALEWLNAIRNRIAHSGEKVDYATAAKGIYACIKTLVVLKENGIIDTDFSVELFRHAKLTAAWTINPPNWIPSGELVESMDFRS
jgi:hypothetical protein